MLVVEDEVLLRLIFADAQTIAMHIAALLDGRGPQPDMVRYMARSASVA